MITACKHPQVRVVARQDDVEFVECQSCREVFDAAEYADMAMEEEEAALGPGDEEADGRANELTGRAKNLVGGRAARATQRAR